jgi:hypothetical protein
MNKRFSKELYDESNTVAMSTAVTILETICDGKAYRLDVPLHMQEESYKSHDFVISRLHDTGTTNVYVEVEKKRVWGTSGKWEGFSTIDVPYRKSESKANLFVMVNNNNDTAAIARMSDVVSSPIESKRTIYTDDEKFFKVGLDKFKFYYNVAPRGSHLYMLNYVDSWIEIKPNGDIF